MYGASFTTVSGSLPSYPNVEFDARTKHIAGGTKTQKRKMDFNCLHEQSEAEIKTILDVVEGRPEKRKKT